MHPATFGSKSSFGDRIRGALMLDRRTYREVEQDVDANGQAVLTVVIAALATGLSAVLSRDVLQNTVGLIVSSVLQWIVFSLVAYFVGSQFFSNDRTSVTPGQVLRTVGFAQAPKFFAILGIVPLLGWIVGLVVFVWFIAAAIVALSEAFEFDTSRAVGTGAVALVGILIVDIILGIFFGISSALFGAMSSMFGSLF